MIPSYAGASKPPFFFAQSPPNACCVLCGTQRLPTVLLVRPSRRDPVCIDCLGGAVAIATGWRVRESFERWMRTSPLRDTYPNVHQPTATVTIEEEQTSDG